MIRKLTVVAMAALAALFLMSPKANADVVVHTVGVHVGSHHFPAANWNNSNPGVYLRGTINNTGWVPPGDYVVGTYYNSERRQSAYVGYVYPIAANFDVVLGAVSGYRRMAVLPMVVPSVHFPVADWTARVSFLPKVDKSGANVVHLSFERSF